MKRICVVLLAFAALAVTLAGCGTTPCQDYCQTFVDKIQKCGLGGPAEATLLQECEDGINESSGQCTMMSTSVDAYSCAQFKAVICEQQGDQAVFNCGD